MLSPPVLALFCPESLPDKRLHKKRPAKKYFPAGQNIFMQFSMRKDVSACHGK